MRLPGYDVDLESSALGAPADAAGWQRGAAGRVAENLQVVCWLRLAGERIEAARFEVFGGPLALRAAVAAAEHLGGMTVAEAASLDGLAIAEAAGLPVAARGEALCVEDALRAALAARTSEGGP